MSSQPHGVNAKKRILEILRILIENPGYYTRKRIAAIYVVSVDTISRDFEEIKNAGFALETDTNHRYYLTAEKTTEQIKDLLVLTD